MEPLLVVYLLASVPLCAQEVAVSTHCQSGSYIGLRCKNLRELIRIAYDVRPEMPIQGGGAWVDTVNYDIEAQKLDGPSLQALLESRFTLEVHYATRMLPGYELKVARGGPKSLVDESSCLANLDMANQNHPCYDLVRGGSVYSTTMAQLSQRLTNALGRTVVDNTNLTLVYKFVLPARRPGVVSDGDCWAVELCAPSSDKSLRVVLPDWGLELVDAKAPGKILAIDHAERPSVN